MTLFRVAARNVFRHRTRSLITLMGIAFGCVAIVFIGGFFEDSLGKMRNGYIHGHTGHLQIYRKGFYEKGSSKPFRYLIENPAEIIGEITRYGEVRRVMQRLQFAALLGTGETSAPCFGQGVEPEYEASIIEAEYSTGGSRRSTELNIARKGPLETGTVIRAGRALSSERPFGAILGQGLAAGVGAGEGDSLILMANTVGGAINAYDVSVDGIFYTGSKVFDDNALRLPLATAQKLLGTEAVQALVVLLHDTSAVGAVGAKLEQLFRERGWDLELKTWRELNDFYVKTEVLFWNYYQVVIAVVCIIVVLSVFNTLNMSVLERTTEIGTIMAMGMKARLVVRLFLYEGFVLGIVGGVLGMLLGVVVVLLVGQIGIPMPPPPGATMNWISNPVLVPAEMLRAFLLSVVIASLSGLYPAYKASRMEIAQALRHVL